MASVPFCAISIAPLAPPCYTTHAMERPSGNVIVDETFKRAPKAKAKGHEQAELL